MSDDHSPLIPCREAVRRLWDYLEGAVTPDDHDLVEAHLAYCRSCCGELAFVGHLRDLLARQAIDEPQPHVVKRLERYLEGLGK